MRVLVLGPNASRIAPALLANGDTYAAQETPLAASDLEGFDWVVSYGYRHIIRAGLLALKPHRFVNLHMAMLPWNRGAHPNYWSWVDDTPKGVTLHEIDAGIDTGPLLAQMPVPLSPDETRKRKITRRGPVGNTSHGATAGFTCIRLEWGYAGAMPRPDARSSELG